MTRAGLPIRLSEKAKAASERRRREWAELGIDPPTWSDEEDKVEWLAWWQAKAAESGIDPKMIEQAGEHVAGRFQSMMLGLIRAAAQEDKAARRAKGPRAAKMLAAIELLLKHPAWTSKRIAEKAGCTPEYLSRSKQWQTARETVALSGVDRRGSWAGDDDYTQDKLPARPC
jgi:hypothetical protein